MEITFHMIFYPDSLDLIAQALSELEERTPALNRFTMGHDDLARFVSAAVEMTVNAIALASDETFAETLAGTKKRTDHIGPARLPGSRRRRDTSHR